MENTNEKQEQVIEETTVAPPTNPLSAGLGEDRPAIQAHPVKILEVKLEDVSIGGKTKQKVVFVVEHPSSEKSLEISSVKHEVKDKVQTHGTWLATDSDNKIVFKSALGDVLRHSGKESLKDLVGLTFDTAVDDNGYLALKAY